MRSISFGRREDGPDSDDRALLEFAELWQSGTPSLERTWAGLRRSRPLWLLTALIKIELSARFRRGERPRAAEFLDRFPELVESSDRVISIVYEEFCLLEDAEGHPDSQEFCNFYGPWGDSLRSQLGYHRGLSQVAGSPMPKIDFPNPGDRFATFQLQSILGQGGAARVFLAIDDGLRGRKVALKISASFGPEPSILARLDHRNIVPILTVTESPESGLRGFSMPYRPGLTLEELIRHVGRGTPPRKAAAIWKLIKPAEVEIDPESDVEAESQTEEDRPGWDAFPIEGTYHEAVAWIGLHLANAIAYLHEKGVLHRDIKPGNVLLAYREGPQLLDFHLAHVPNAPPHAQAALNGGTLPYMAPEQLRAFVDPSFRKEVDKPADIYSLGLVLSEMVTGRGPDLPNADLPVDRAINALLDRRLDRAVEVRQINPSIPPAMESIIAKCLAPCAADRYQSARALGADLQHFLDRLPLASARNTSRIERGANFAYRNRKSMVGIVLLVASYCAVETVRTILTPSLVNRPEFREAVPDLDSESKPRWEHARDIFQRLAIEAPQSAWPLLYLGLTWEKLGDAAMANRLTVQACNFTDADQAVEHRLREHPPTTTLLTAQGILLVKRERYKEARIPLNAALATERNHLGALATLAEVERNLDNTYAAIGCLTRAIEAAGQAPQWRESILVWRTALLPLLVTQSDKRFVNDPTLAVPQQAEQSLDAIAAQMVELELLWKELPGAKGAEVRDYTRRRSAGIVQSGRGKLAADRRDFKAADRQFQDAQRSFKEALAMIPPGSPWAMNNQANLQGRLADVDRRLLSLPKQ